MLAARVRAAPSDGEANAALVRLVAAVVGLPASRVRLVAGSTARLEVLELSGDPAVLAASLSAGA